VVQCLGLILMNGWSLSSVGIVMLGVYLFAEATWCLVVMKLVYPAVCETCSQDRYAEQYPDQVELASGS
jgi:hypothetical protein